MAALKKYGFLILNGVILLSTLVLYLVSVSGKKEELDALEVRLERERKTLLTLASRKPTQQWYEILQKNLDEVEKGLAKIESGPREADKYLHRYFDLSNPAEITGVAPAPGNYQVFKELMVRKWDNLISAFCGENSPFGLAEAVLGGIEPKWLRGEVPPTHSHQVLNAMKNYWITSELLELLSENEVLSLSKLTVSGLVRAPAYQHSGKDFWGYRNIVLEGTVDLAKVEDLFEVFSSSQRPYRLTGFSFANVIATPRGVFSDAPFMRFSESQPQRFRLNLMHFDYLAEEESFEGVAIIEAEGAAPPRRPRRSRR